MAFAVRNISIDAKNAAGKSKSTKKDWPLCSHCGILGYTQDRYYKLHGYPLGYDKTKGKPTPISVHQVYAREMAQALAVTDVPTQLTSSQVQQLLLLLQNQNLHSTVEQS